MDKKVSLLLNSNASAEFSEPSGLGSHYGTLSGKISHFSAETKPKPRKAPELKNMMTNPPKKGSGYGYCDVTLGKPMVVWSQH